VLAVATACALAATGAACRGDALPTSDAPVSEVVTPSTTETATPTVVERREPTMTPTATPTPLTPVLSVVIPDMPVPYAAELRRFAQGGQTADALADYSLADADADTLRQWYLEQMPAYGWDKGEDRDGALIFQHLTQKSIHPAEGEDDARTATILFDRADDIAISILCELPR
jgi:hypothetical protein